MIVPMPWPSPIVALTAFARLTMKVSLGSSSDVAVDGHGDRLGRLARGEGQRAAGGAVVGRRDALSVRGGVVDGRRVWPLGAPRA